MVKVNKKKLLDVLKKVKPGLSNKEFIEQSTHFAFMGDRIVTYNDEISVSCMLPDVGITCAVSAPELFSFLSKTPEEEITITLTENEMQIFAGKAKAGLVIKSEIKLPLTELQTIEQWEKVPVSFQEGLQFCTFSTSKDMSRPLLTCIHVTKEFLESCDNCRYTRVNILEKSGIPSFLLPAKFISDLCQHKISDMAVTDGWVHFRTTDKGVVFSCRVFNDPYPNTEGIRQIDNSEKVRLPNVLGEILDRAEVFADMGFNDQTFATILLKEGQITVEAENATGWFKETTPCRYKGKDIKFSISTSFFKEALIKLQKCSVGTTKLRFEGEYWEHIVGLAE